MIQSSRSFALGKHHDVERLVLLDEAVAPSARTGTAPSSPSCSSQSNALWMLKSTATSENVSVE